MSQVHKNSHLDEVVRPTCAKCGTPMWLTRVEPDGPSLDKQTFECPACENDLIEVVKHH
jgi:hypothetical protein